MKTIIIQHPLRTISYKTQDEPYFMPSEHKTLQAYRAAHDEAWRMKMRFEQASGEVLLVQHRLDDINYELRELENMWGYYTEQLDFSAYNIQDQIELRFQVELRDFYLQVRRAHQDTIEFYDQIARQEMEYKQLTDTYYRHKKPLDPLDFHVLDDIFNHPSDRDTDIVSLDADLQAFLKELTGIYQLLEDYLIAYSMLTTAYHHTLAKLGKLQEAIKPLDRVWNAGIQ